MQRLYIGGLSHTVTSKDLKDRFGKFGDVQDVELRTRRDDEGVPYKTFGYINISISEANLKKCMTVLNKSKWKGGTLQIETAKESFLTRLAEERQEIAKQNLQQPETEDHRQKMLDSLSSAGVDNFTMKAAVPGSEVPGHKDWVVSKFGRVLPILQLRCQKGTKNRTMKYDPSKYCHNIRKLDRSAEGQPTPVHHLTWELQGGDDDISKKRRGEFPPYEPPRPKKSQTNTCSGQDAERNSRFKPTINAVHHVDAVTNRRQQSVSVGPPQRRWALRGSDADSDEEIRRMVAAQDASHVALRQEVDEDHLEVVGLDYLTKSDHFSHQHNGHTGDLEQNDYDSADTDELLASSKPPPPQERLTSPTRADETNNHKERKRKTKKKRKAEEEDEEDDSADEEQHVTNKKLLSTQQKLTKQTSKGGKKIKISPVVESPVSESGDDGDEEMLNSDSSSESDYEAMFSNVTQLEISFADLQRLAEVFEQTAAPSSSSQTSITPKPTPKKGTTPEEILAALMEDSSDDEPKKKKKKRKGAKSAPLPAFQGTNALYQGSETEEPQEKELEEKVGKGVKKQKQETESSESEEEEDEEGKEEEEEEEEEEDDEKLISEKASNAEKSTSSPDDDDDDDDEVEEDEESHSCNNQGAKVDAASSHSSSAVIIIRDKDDEPNTKEAVEAAPPAAPHGESSSSEDDEEEEEQKGVIPAQARPSLKPEEEEELQKLANLRRLAAVQQRQKEAEEQKKLIQGALAKLDTPTAKAGKHIVFGSDDDDDDEEEVDDSEIKQQSASKVPESKKTLFEDSSSEEEASGDKTSTRKKDVAQEKVPQCGPQLFSGSEDEDRDEEEDGRFNIRPQFEGPAGQKLMALQSRFGTDERFRMDSRFLEDEDEEEDNKAESERKREKGTEEEEVLEDEKKRTLSILQSVLGSSQQTCSNKPSSKAKTFKDVSALHYDPSREEHAAFETKTTEIKESKSARRKKREEALKLPEVSKEIFYDVSGDLKAVFGQAKVEDNAEEENTGWDQVEEEEEEEERKEEQEAQSSPSLPADPEEKQEESSGFKFSFFGDDADTGTAETEYKVENIQAPKVSWQQDPRFHDSSSEDDDDDDEEPEEEEDQSNIMSKSNEETAPSASDMFFFSAEDSRLTEGPKLFCRPSQLEEQREQWEEMRSMLRQEYRKKHKDARRKLKSSQKS